MIDKVTELAVERITEQMKPYKKEGAECYIGQLLIKLCEADPQAAELIAQDLIIKKMNLAAITSKVRNMVTEQSKKNNSKEGGLEDKKALEIICEFYGIDSERYEIETTIKLASHPKKPISFMDLLRGGA